MKTEKARTELLRVFTVYPSLGDYINDHPTPKETMAAWCGMLSHCDEALVIQVVNEIVGGYRDPVEKYDKPDALPRRIVQECKFRRNQQIEKERSKQLQEMGHNRGTWKAVATSRTGSLAVRLGDMVKHSVLTPEENDARMSELLAYDKGEVEKPDWVDHVAAWVVARPFQISQSASNVKRSGWNEHIGLTLQCITERKEDKKCNEEKRR